jgi:ferritin-like metal-binding protein YciE
LSLRSGKTLSQVKSIRSENMKLATVANLFEDQLKDIYSAEAQLVSALPRMAKRASSRRLREALRRHLEETKHQLERLEEIRQALGVELAGERCEAMEVLIAEGAEVLDAEGPEPLIDAALIVAAQRVEHYEISAYGSACAFARQLGCYDAVELLQDSLNEESAADEKLTSLFEEEILPAAAEVEELIGR